MSDSINKFNRAIINFKAEEQKLEKTLEDLTKTMVDELFESCEEVYSIFWTEPQLDLPGNVGWKSTEDRYDDYENGYKDGYSSVIFSKSNLEAAKENLEDAKLFKSDLDAYRRKHFTKKEVDDFNEYLANHAGVQEEYQKVKDVFIKTPNSVEYATNYLDVVENNIAKWGNRGEFVEKQLRPVLRAIESIPGHVLANFNGGDYYEITLTREGTKIDRGTMNDFHFNGEMNLRADDINSATTEGV